jgi:hypothetical protein
MPEGSSMKLDKPRVQEALNLFADSLRMRGKEDLAFMIENYDVLLKEEWQAEQPETKKRAPRNKL